MKHHIVPVRIYLTIILTLMVLTAITVGVAFVDLGFLNTVVAISIAVVKALLVVMFFMHLKYSARVLWLVAGAGLAWFVLMVALTLSDFRTRDWLGRPQPWTTAAPPSQVH